MGFIFYRFCLTVLFFLGISFVIKAQLPVCIDSFPASLLTNSSFEQYSGCNLTYSDLEGGYIDYPISNGGITVNSWHSYLNSSPVYYHNYSCKSNSGTSIFDTTSFFTSFADYPAIHLPLPDSSGFIHISQTLPKNDHGVMAGNSYIATCLSTPLYAGQTYIFSFYLCFGKTKSNYLPQPITSPSPAGIGIFGRQDCPVFPVAQSNDGCLSNNTGWVELGNVTLRGNYGWVQGTIEFTPQTQITSIGVGLDCKYGNYNYGTSEKVYYLDKFILAPKADFSFKLITATSGDACNGNYILEAPSYSNAHYQWYKNDSLIAGAVSKTYEVPNTTTAAGDYITKIDLPYNACLYTLPYTIAFSDLKQFSLGNDTTFCAPQQINLTAEWANAQSYLWQDGSSQSNITINKSGEYWVQLTDIYGCTKKDSIKVTVEGCEDCRVFIPSAFTPNNDRINDIFKPISQCANIGFNFYNMTIYNRWGKPIFTSSDFNKGWDGTNNNSFSESGVYIYMINYTDKQGKHFTKKGTIVLLR